MITCITDSNKADRFKNYVSLFLFHLVSEQKLLMLMHKLRV